MRFLIFIYGKSRMKRTQLVSDKRAECHILLPKDDFSLERTVFLQFKNISGEWFIKETDCCHLKTEEFFQMGKRKSDEGIFYKLSIGRKNELSVGGKDLYVQLIRYRNDWSIYKKYKLRDCRIIKEKNIFIMMEKAINRKNSMGISYEYGKWFIEKCGNIEIYINEILLEKKQQLEFGDVICIGTIYLLFFENYIAVEAGERNTVSDYLEEVVLENEIKGQEDVRKKEKREITFHRAPRVMEELKKVSLKVDAPPQVDVQEKKSIFMDAVILLDLINSVCEEGTVIEIFQKHNALGYAEFSYALGLGYFYDMGNITGKGASEKWFCEAIDTMTSQDENEAFGKQKRKRAGLYAKIANYYNTFLLNGTDQSGERGTGDFMDFYKTLHSLNQFEVTQKSTKSDLAAAYLISREITIEIMNYAEQFLKDSSINKKMLNKELEKIEERTKYFIKEKKQMEELYQFMNEAKQKIEIADSFKDKEDVRDAGGT